MCHQQIEIVPETAAFISTETEFIVSRDLYNFTLYIHIHTYINLLVSGLHKIHIISNTVFHAARNLQGEGVDVALVRIELEKTTYIHFSS